ncbi:RHS repeat-associated core domain-containing protein [Streptomyces sp. NPDC059568]|uniref:RHS repeat-associated core domain-containing protein n=1 Tax=Streptomyces sp. NPDC059568 TaxID=3346868 RepID=UPI00367E2750
MTPLDTKHTVRFAAPAKTDVVLKTPKIPGLEVRIPKGSVVRDEKGRAVTELGITAIPIDRPPFPLPQNSVVPVFFTVQPGGTYVFPKGAQIVYPNYTREAPGTRVEFMDYDPKKKGWYVYGHGKVSRDGRQVVPDAKTRVWAFHGAMFNVADVIPWEDTWVEDVVDWLSGDPVELSTGMLTDSRTDLAVNDSRGSADITRTYWQGDTRKRAFGIGRDLSYNVFLHSAKQYEQVDLYLPGGSKVHYTRTSPGTSWTDAVFEPLDTPSGFRGSKIVWKPYPVGGWELTFRDGTVWLFPNYAPLKEIRDRHGNAVKITRLDGNYGEITRISTPSGRWISLSYDTDHRVVGAKDNTGRTTGYTYDSTGRLETVTDPAGKVSRYTYDGTSNRIRTAVDARGITYMANTFDADGRVREQTLTEGAKYTFDYTKTGTGVGRVTSASVTEPGGAVRRVEFDADGYGTSDTQAYGSTLARKTVYQRGSYHRIDAVTDPYGRRTELAYDVNGYVTSVKELAGTPQARSSGTAVFDGPFDQPTAVTDPLGKTTRLAYGADGDLDTVTDPENRVTAFTHTADGQVETVTDASGAVTEYTYQHGELTAVKDAEGRTAGQFLDAAGRPVVTTDEAGARTTVTYDALNQARKVTDPLGRAITLDYDDNGNLTTLTDARDNTTTWAYDTADRPKSATDPLGAQAQFAYDPAGQLARVTSRTGEVATAEYDLLGRAKNAKYGVDLAGQAESTTTYAYDSVDLPKTVTDTVAGTQSFTYDAYDRTKTVTGPTGTVGYNYDAADRRTEMTAGGTATRYGYDTSGILTSVTTGGQAVTFGLDAVGREKTASLPGGFTRTTGYDKTGWATGIAYTRGAAAVGDLAYTRDERGLQTGLTGSLASVALPAAETGAVFGKDNRLTTFNGRSFTYDAEGQLTSDGKRAYDWNARGELTSLTEAGGRASGFTYDPLGTRTATTLGGTTRKFLTDASNPLAEQSGSGETTATVAASGLDEYLTRTENGRTQVYLTDALGTVVGLADPDGTVATRYTYDPYGQPTATGAASTNPYTFTGRENDGTGLLYYRNRYYDPETGRFISQDPIGHAGGTNLYQYALSSPTTYTDPSGNNPLLAACAGGALSEAFMDWGLQRLSGRKVNWNQVALSALGGCLGGMLGVGLGGKLAARGGCNSFTPDTPVLMADGTHKAIKDIRIGDKVLATDPETGESGPREVTALIEGTGDKTLVDITIDSATGPGKLTATDGHPFWVPALREWVEAAKLQPGQWLQTSTGTWTQITAVTHRTQKATVNNLTVDDLHTYYVLAGQTPALVHNCNVALGQKAEGTYEWAEKLGYKHFGKLEGWQGPVEAAIRDTSNILHVNMKGVGSFADAARDGLTPGHPFATDVEMGMIARSVVHGGRSWDSVKFYRPGKGGSLVEFSVPEPDWGSFGRIRPYID